MNTREDVARLLSSQLGPAYPASTFSGETRLLGAIPELDSMAVVGLLTAIEETFGIQIADDAVSADDFETVATLVAFVDGHLQR